MKLFFGLIKVMSGFMASYSLSHVSGASWYQPDLNDDLEKKIRKMYKK